MDQVQMVAMVEDYFSSVDRKDVDRLSEFFLADSIFTIATFNLVYRGKDDILAMFRRLNARYDKIWHGNFIHFPCGDSGRIASQFDVRNLCFDGTVQEKKNANFFRISGETFSRVDVYMSGENSLT